MPTYHITMQVNRFIGYAVEADSKEQAIKQINKDLAESCDDWTDYDTSVIHSMEVTTNA
tara:strand:+ start:316 stop:492 length:177 start_codon:yes stop_codon:yes gene_type:complete